VEDRSGTGVDASDALAGKLRTLIQLIDKILRQIAAAAVRGTPCSPA